jgi:hypothetical protein
MPRGMILIGSTPSRFITSGPQWRHPKPPLYCGSIGVSKSKVASPTLVRQSRTLLRTSMLSMSVMPTVRNTWRHRHDI